MANQPIFNSFLSDLSSLSESIRQIKGRVVILTHNNADPDAIGSSMGLYELIQQINPDIIVDVCFKGINLLAKKVWAFCYPNVEIKGWDGLAKNEDCLFLVDCNSPSLTGYSKADLEIFGTVIVIDHHTFNEETDKWVTYYFCYSGISSVCEILLMFFFELNIQLTKPTATVLLLGIISDSRRFYYATEDTFKTVSRLLSEYKLDYSKIRKELDIEKARSERIALLRAASRIKILTLSEGIFVISSLSAFEASAARSLVFMGADIAAVLSSSKEESRISIRAREKFCFCFGIHIGKMLGEYLGEFYKGTGSGHQNVAGINIPRKLIFSNFERVFFDRVRELISLSKRENTLNQLR